MRVQPIAFGTTWLLTVVALTVLAAFVLGVFPTGSNGADNHVVGASQPIEVHGAWTLSLLNIDGSVARTVEFNNALGGLGAEYLADFFCRRQDRGKVASPFVRAGSSQSSVCNFLGVRLGVRCHGGRLRRWSQRSRFFPRIDLRGSRCRARLVGFGDGPTQWHDQLCSYYSGRMRVKHFGRRLRRWYPRQ